MISENGSAFLSTFLLDLSFSLLFLSLVSFSLAEAWMVFGRLTEKANLDSLFLRTPEIQGWWKFQVNRIKTDVYSAKG